MPESAEQLPRVPDAAYVAPSSLLVFDHLTRRVALLHDGSEAQRKALRAEVIAALRGPLPPQRGRRVIEPAQASLSAEQYCDLVRKAQGFISPGRCLSNRPVGLFFR